MQYAYDGLYRAVYGKTHDASYTLTETDSIFNVSVRCSAYCVCRS